MINTQLFFGGRLGHMITCKSTEFADVEILGSAVLFLCSKCAQPKDHAVSSYCF